MSLRDAIAEHAIVVSPFREHQTPRALAVPEGRSAGLDLLFVEDYEERKARCVRLPRAHAERVRGVGVASIAGPIAVRERATWAGPHAPPRLAVSRICGIDRRIYRRVDGGIIGNWDRTRWLIVVVAGREHPSVYGRRSLALAGRLSSFVSSVQGATRLDLVAVFVRLCVPRALLLTCCRGTLLRRVLVGRREVATSGDCQDGKQSAHRSTVAKPSRVHQWITTIQGASRG